MGASEDFDDRFVTLQGGMIVPAPAFVLMLDLERRAFTVSRDGDTFVVGPAAQLTPEDCAAIRRWKHHLLMLLDYCARPDLDKHLFTDAATSPRSAA